MGCGAVDRILDGMRRPLFHLDRHTPIPTLLECGRQRLRHIREAHEPLRWDPGYGVHLPQCWDLPQCCEVGRP